MDEAVKSRVHMIFKYPALGWDETKEVFRLNLRMLRQTEQDRANVMESDLMDIHESEIEQFAHAHFFDKPRQRWNGRQIRNAFQIARSLAHFEYEDAEKRGERNHKLSLGARHFSTVAEATMAFDEYKQTTIGKSDEENAASRMERARERDVPSYRPEPASSWRQNYGEGLYSSRPRTPQPSSQYSYSSQYSVPPPQQTPSPHPSFSLGGASAGPSMAPAHHGYMQDRMSTPS